ncbi:hypothetical protein [Sphingomonas sp. CLY1604]|uniref:hypothetical protein n=1 Tax=Sphingomonas sp. CLY1604 TaxID=3457786 RepID=UPI003FD8B090
MQPHADIEYYMRRERQERALADNARHLEGRNVHLEMAKRYARLIAEAQDEPRPTLRMRVKH